MKDTQSTALPQPPVLPDEAYVLPRVMTPAVAFVLALMPWQIIPIARVLQRAGYSVPKRAEDEKSHTLFFLLPYAIAYGDDWWTHAQEVLQALDKASGGKP